MFTSIVLVSKICQSVVEKTIPAQLQNKTEEGNQLQFASRNRPFPSSLLWLLVNA